jgi:3-methylcrotonyl-CoA carboxylase beta subunit
MIIANDATVKAGAFFPMTCKKIIRAQTIAMMARLPLIYLVDSAGVFLPLQEDVFPDTDDFGRIFRNNAVISADGIPQIAAIMGFCVAGGGYLPVLCDTLLMTEGSGLYLAGPALVKAAIGQEVTDEELGGASMHASISGTIDFKEKDDESCIRRVRDLVAKYNDSMPGCLAARLPSSYYDSARVYDVFTDKPGTQYDVKDSSSASSTARFAAPAANPAHESLAPDFDEYKADYGQSIVCGYAKIGGHACGIVANQKKLVQRTMPGGKQARPQVRPDARRHLRRQRRQGRPLHHGLQPAEDPARLPPRHHRLHGRARQRAGRHHPRRRQDGQRHVQLRRPQDRRHHRRLLRRGQLRDVRPRVRPVPRLRLAERQVRRDGRQPGDRHADHDRRGKPQTQGRDDRPRDAQADLLGDPCGYTEQADIRHAAARGWVDRIIEPHKTRDELIAVLNAARSWDYSKPFKTGVLQT